MRLNPTTGEHDLYKFESWALYKDATTQVKMFLRKTI